LGCTEIVSLKRNGPSDGKSPAQQQIAVALERKGGSPRQKIQLEEFRESFF